LKHLAKASIFMEGGCRCSELQNLCNDGHPRGLAVLAWLLPLYDDVLIPRMMPSAPRICFVGFL
jgi:hypothetical protein